MFVDEIHATFNHEDSTSAFFNLWRFVMRAPTPDPEEAPRQAVPGAISVLEPGSGVARRAHPVACPDGGELGFKVNEQPASYEAIHRALLPGLLGHIGFKGRGAGVPGGAQRPLHDPPLVRALTATCRSGSWRCSGSSNHRPVRAHRRPGPAGLDRGGRSPLDPAQAQSEPHWQASSGPVRPTKPATSSTTIVPKWRAESWPDQSGGGARAPSSSASP